MPLINVVIISSSINDRDGSHWNRGQYATRKNATAQNVTILLFD